MWRIQAPSFSTRNQPFEDEDIPPSLVFANGNREGQDTGYHNQCLPAMAPTRNPTISWVIIMIPINGTCNLCLVVYSIDVQLIMIGNKNNMGGTLLLW